MYHVLVAASLSDAGLHLLSSDPDVRLDLCGPLLDGPVRDLLADSDALIVSSQSVVNEQLLDGAPRLRVIGRAGAGLDNIGIGAATRRGVLIMNVPGGNTTAAAEHTMALLLALCRNVLQSNSSLGRGEWRRDDFLGVQLFGKTLGVIGLGQVGSRVARQGQGFGMDIVAYDPHISVEAAQSLRVTLLELDELLGRSDFITLHVPLTPATRGFIGAREIGRMKRGVRIVNTARGALINASDLYRALSAGHVAGVALDVFETEPPQDDPLLALPNVIATPHLGSKTQEAQRDISTQIVRQVLDALRDRDYRNVVNMPFVDGVSFSELLPYLDLAERIGSVQMQLAQGRTTRVEVEYRGEEIAELVKPLTVALLKGLLTHVVGRDQVNYVNAPLLASERGIVVSQTKGLPGPDYPSLVSCRLTTDSGERLVAGTLFSRRLPRIVQIDEYRMDALPEGIMLIMVSQDVPGVIGQVGTFLGKHQINIAEWRLGRNHPGERALSVINLDATMSDHVMEELAALPEVLSIRQVVV